MIRILKKEKCCTLAMSENNIPYLVPMFYELCNDLNGNTIKLVSFNNGKKMRCISSNSNVRLLVEHRGFNYLDTIIISGFAKIEQNCDNSSNIYICVKDITGRRYCY